ncbi:CgeB family protein [Pseudomonas putida]
MKSGISKTQAAFTAFNSGEYQTALSLYQELANNIGSPFFEINIQICERRLASACKTYSRIENAAHETLPKDLEHADLAESPVHKKIDQPESSNHQVVLSSSPTINNNTTQSGSIELSDQMEWYEILVKQGDDVTVKAGVTYLTQDGTNRRKAVMVVTAFDTHGKEMDFSCGQLAKSRHLQGYFKYVNCNLGKVANLHNFKIPTGAERVRIGLCRFNATATDRIIIDSLQLAVKPKNGTSTAFTAPSQLAAELSILGWPEHKDNGRPYAVGIMDEFTTGCFEEELNLVQPRPDNWYALAEKYPPAFFFIESAWKGNQSSWQYRVADYAMKPGQEVSQITQYARQKNIPTAFWNKEDPVHHQKFMCSAQLVDHIFTTDANMCESYRKHTGNSNVHALPFAAQPALHKPAPLAGRLARSCFAGSWYGDRHAERGQAMRWLLTAANRYGLDIYDRNHGTGAFPFPEEYQQGIKGSLPYKALCEEYSRYRVFLNVNSVIDSPTMFSRRVFELMASGTPVVSTYARGIEELFDSDAVWLVHSEDEADYAIRTLLTDEAEWRRRSLAGIREVFSRHTYKHRLDFMLEKMGLSDHIRAEPELLLIAKANSTAELQALISIAERQSYQHFHLIIETTAGLEMPSPPQCVEMVKKGFLSSSALQSRAEAAKAIGWMSPHADYGNNYLQDLINAMLYQPEASGWAKSLELDAFSYGCSSVLCASIWEAGVFFAQHIRSQALGTVSHDQLFCIDSDEFLLKTSIKNIA